MRRFLLTVSALALLSLPAIAQDPWTPEEWRAGMRKLEQTRYAFTGVAFALWFSTSLETDCSVSENFSVEVIKEPEHGTVDIVPAKGFPGYLKGNERAKCNEMKVEGYNTVYRSNVGYTGDDTLSIVEIYSSGYARELTVHLKVRKSKATKGADAIPLPPVRVR